MHAYGDVTLVASWRSPRASEVTLRMLSLEHYHPPGAQKVLPKLYTLSFKQAREVQGGGVTNPNFLELLQLDQIA